MSCSNQITLTSLIIAKVSLISMRSLKYWEYVLSLVQISVRDNSNHTHGISHPKGHSHQGNVTVSPYHQSQTRYSAVLKHKSRTNRSYNGPWSLVMMPECSKAKYYIITSVLYSFVVNSHEEECCYGHMFLISAAYHLDPDTLFQFRHMDTNINSETDAHSRMTSLTVISSQWSM